MKLAILLFLLPICARASVLDTAPPVDALGHWEFDLYDASGNQRGTLGNAFRIDPIGTTAQPTTQSGTWSVGRTWNLTAVDVVSAVQSGTWNITNITGTVSLPTGAATSAKQPSLGTAGTASTDVITVQGIASGVTLPVTVGNFPATQPISASALPLPVGAATSALQTSGNAMLTSIDAGIPAGLGQTTSANSMPVVISSDQSAVPTTLTKVGLTASAPAGPTVGTTSAALVAANATRKGLIIQNNSTNLIFLAFGTTAAVNVGIGLFPGGTYEMDEYNFTTAAVNAIATGASSQAEVQEFTP